MTPSNPINIPEKIELNYDDYETKQNVLNRLIWAIKPAIEHFLDALDLTPDQLLRCIRIIYNLY